MVLTSQMYSLKIPAIFMVVSFKACKVRLFIENLCMDGGFFFVPLIDVLFGATRWVC